MPQYRAYRLNPAGKIVTGDWLEAADEAAALRLAHEMCDEATPSVELWLGARRIAVVPCEDEAAA